MPLKIATGKQGISWHGSFFVTHSLALVNRELALALLDKESFRDRFDLRLDHFEEPAFSPDAEPRFAPLGSRIGALPGDLRVTLRHRWPPDLSKPVQGQLAVIQPWEFGAVPKEWIHAIGRSVDEVWVPSQFVRDCYINSGAPASRVFTVPNGINPALFHPDVEPYDFTTNPLTHHLGPGTFKFLFVGGTLVRKGVDLLLDAYDRAFSAKDRVTLIIKDFGANSFYANQGMGALIRALQQKPGGANIIYLNDDMTEREIAGLYAACDCLVHPYRGEGYGLPIAEAMACGKPAILTGAGAAMDFANESNAYLIPAAMKPMPQNSISGMELAGQPFWAEPDRDALIETLRRVSADPDAAREVGRKAAAHMAAEHTWATAADVAMSRFCALAEGRTASQQMPAVSAAPNIGESLFAEDTDWKSDIPIERRKRAGLYSLRDGNFAAALEQLQACAEEAPHDPAVVAGVGVCMYRLGDLESGLKQIRQAIYVAQNKASYQHLLATLLLRDETPVTAQDADTALEAAMAAFRTEPGRDIYRDTADKARKAVLEAARARLHGGSAVARATNKRDPEYRALMSAYRDATDALDRPALKIAAPPATARSESKSKSKSRAAVNVKTSISLCMIVKNEERFLEKCLQSARDFVDEIVVVDTGSTDSSVEIARRYNAKVVFQPWTDDFSAARNIALEHATGNWALWLDADEEIAPGTGAAFRAAAENAPDHLGGYLVPIRNWMQDSQRSPGGETAIHHACRLFRLEPGVRFEGRIHEQNLRSLMGLGYAFDRDERMLIDHFGYAAAIMSERNKHERFIRMLVREVEECPDPSMKHFHLFNLGNAYFTQGDMENAAKYLAEAAENPNTAEEFTLVLYTELATALQRLNRSEEGLAWCDAATKLGIRHCGVEFARGYCLLHMEKYTEAERAFKLALEYGEESGGAYGASGDPGAGSFKARHGVALALTGQDRYEDVVPVCEENVQKHPGFGDARYLLGVALARLERNEEARRAFEELLQQDPEHDLAKGEAIRLAYESGDYEAATPYLQELQDSGRATVDMLVQLGQCYAETNRPQEARDTYEELRILAPDSPEIAVNLGRALAACGQDAEAIDSFADALEIDPDCSNAMFNAGDLLYKLQSYKAAIDTYMSGLQVTPEHADGFFMLGNCYVRTGDYTAAVICFTQAQSLSPHRADIMNNLQIARELAATEAAAA